MMKIFERIVNRSNCMSNQSMGFIVKRIIACDSFEFVSLCASLIRLEIAVK